MDKQWLQTLGKMPYGIYILTAAYEDEMNGMVASWVSQVSFAPPLVMVAIHPNRYSHDLITRSRCFALHSLLSNQGDLIKRFKGPDPLSKFESLQWSKGVTGAPLLEECLGYLECAVREKYAPGNHTLFLGEIIDARICRDGDPLTTLAYAGSYVGAK